MMNRMNDILQQQRLDLLDRTIQFPDAEEHGVRNPSKEAYGMLISAYDYFSRELFGGTLPPCLITLPRRRQATLGYFWKESWADTDNKHLTDEICLNPIHFESRSPEETFSTLVHEMVHLQQHHFGKPGRGAYHNKEWGRLMRGVGLVPSDTGQPGGKEIGERMSHYIEEGGAFQRACRTLLESGLVMPWHTVRPPHVDEGWDHDGDDDDKTMKKRASKTKYSCLNCGVNAWAKPEVSLLCGTCHRELVSSAI